jgi:3-hydroxyisobutyrate dehydrogenase-like beta-hydroxyacid dehydrogenase
MTRLIGILHPGEMGAAVGAALVGVGHRVVWASEGRSEATRARASSAALEDVGTTARVAAEAGVVFSVCPPAAAIDTAKAVAGFSGVYVDANAIAPSTAERIGAIVSGGGAAFVDGGLVGRPPEHRGDLRLYLSGGAAGDVAALFEGTVVDARVLGREIGAASSLKCAYAAWTKGTIALLLAVCRYARASGTEDALVEEWAESLPDLAARLERSASSVRAKGWRWIAEMKEIAAAFESAGLPGGFHAAAAEVFTLPPLEPSPERGPRKRVEDG